MEYKKIPPTVINRLPRYHRYLCELMEEGITKISSKELSEKMGTTASQIRQDFHYFGGFGQQGYGYSVPFLYEEIAKMLGIDKKQNFIVIGAGNLGKAIANYPNFESRGFLLKAIFDKDPNLTGKKVRGYTIRAIEDLEDFLSKEEVKIATLAIPKEESKSLVEDLVRLGIKGIWNFSHIDLEVPEDVVVENVHISESLMKLSYHLSNKNYKK